MEDQFSENAVIRYDSNLKLPFPKHEFKLLELNFVDNQFVVDNVKL